MGNLPNLDSLYLHEQPYFKIAVGLIVFVANVLLPLMIKRIQFL